MSVASAIESVYPTIFEPGESFARELDERDPLASYRDQFFLPKRPDGTSLLYFCGHSLGPQPKGVREAAERELDIWARRGVEGHFQGDPPWYKYADSLRAPMAPLVGALPDEVVLMNGLTINLHLMMLTFYRPTTERYKILIEEPTFPSDLYAVKSQLRHHGIDVAKGLLTLRPRKGEYVVDTEEPARRRRQRQRDRLGAIRWHQLLYGSML